MAEEMNKIEKEIPETEKQTVSEEALAIAKKQAKLSYRIKRARWSYGMLAPYFILPGLSMNSKGGSVPS